MAIEVPRENDIKYTSFEQRKTEHSLYKEEIAIEAAKYISEGQAIALDSGTTSLELARVIKKNSVFSQLLPIHLQ